MTAKILDIEGKIFGDLVVLTRVENDKHGKSRWICRCICGNEKVIIGSSLVSGKTRSCGCRLIKHNLRGHKLYRTWQDMKNRCLNKNTVAYKNYGDRGITVCDEWMRDFHSFYLWAMANEYSPELSLDRIDVNSGYCPDNCKWSTIIEQNRNKRTNIKLFYKGIYMSVAEFSKETNIIKGNIYRKLKQGYKIEEIIDWGRKSG